MLPVAPPIGSASDKGMAIVHRLEEVVLEKEQIPIETDHILHAGTYARTITLPPGALLVGSLMKVDTTLIIDGDVTVYTGNDPAHFTGYNVVPTAAGRKTAFLAHTETHLTMLFATGAKTVGEAEAEFTDEVEKLGSRRDGSVNNVTITGV